MILAALPWTIGLLIVATILAFGLGTLLGALMAWPGSPRVLNYLVARCWRSRRCRTTCSG